MIPLSEIGVLFLPFLACLVLTGIHGYLGLHVLERKVIFVDLAMAQIAALGATVAFLLGHELHSTTAYFLSLGFTLLGAGVFALTRTRIETVPQEAVIGLVYAVASSAAVLLADRAAHGGEHLKALLQGSIVFVQPPQLLKTAAIYAAIGAFHFAFRKRFLQVTLDPEAARADGVRVRLWDFLFYLSFGLVITSSVSIAGVLLVFCYLIAPAVAAALFASSIRSRLLVAWSTGAAVSALGLLFSWERPSGPTLICFFAAFLAAAAAGKAVFGARSRGRAAALAAACTLAVVASGWAVVRFLKVGEGDGHEHEALEHSVGESPADLLKALGDEHAGVRAHAAKVLGEKGRREAVPELVRLLSDREAAVKEAAAGALASLRATEAVPELLRVARAPDEDEWVPLEAAAAAAGLGEKEGVTILLRLARDAEAGAVRRAALKRLKELLPESGASPDPKKGIEELSAWWAQKGSTAAFSEDRRAFVSPEK